MSVEITTPDDADEWNRVVDRAEGATPFHRFEALEVFAEHTGSTLHPLIGYKGQEAVGLFPLFGLRKGPLMTAFSPPPDKKISYLGPVVLSKSGMKRRKSERRHRRFVESALEQLDDALDPRYINVRTPIEYDDPRPFVWNDFTPSPRYTYRLDIDRDPDEILESASSDLRSNVRKTDRDAYEITDGGRTGMEQIVTHAKQRHEEQDVDYDVTPAFVRDLSHALNDAIHSYVCTADDRFVGGTIVLRDEETVYRWQSVADFDASVPAQDLLDWHVIEEAAESDRAQYDLVGANNPRLCEYKAKFAPDVNTYYELERSGSAVNLLKNVYSLIN